MIVLENLTFSDGEKVLFDAVNERFPNGKRYGFWGDEGSGKTALFDLMTGVSEPDAGSVRINGFDLQKEFAAAHRSFSYLPAGFCGDAGLTVYEYLNFIASAYRTGGEKQFRRVHAAMELTGIEHLRNRKTESLTLWEARRVGIAQTLVTGSEILFFDSPEAGLSASEKEELIDLFSRLPEGTTLFCASDDREFLCRFCDTLLTVGDGTLGDRIDLSPAEESPETEPPEEKISLEKSPAEEGGAEE